ncbi:FtsB family cell division protein [Rhodothermus profundi]|uniref:Cell division protein FtsB n=1 Tax=Rhodothermus profundi TaxID=633813 RepID=A0A1M6V9E9_9BACT|nr:septum formation initiator family protein [Rhodothermus profundi]SHK78102.1 cell division protein FtsB [Rhodothermus profundi]
MSVPRYTDIPPPSRRRRRRRLLIGGLLVLLGIWLAFLDSHSLYRRIRWSYEAARLRAQNEALRQRIDSLKQQLKRGITDEMIERIAREQYGMRRPGETVYRVEE